VIRHLVIFGAGGDLTAGYLLPSLAQLYEAGKLPEGLAILGLGRRDWETDAFRRHIAEWLDRAAAPLSATTREAVLAMLQYRRADVTRSQEVAAAVPRGNVPIVAYLALAPTLFAPTIEALAGTGLPADSRIVIEKPFGEDLASAQALNRLLHETFPERAVFRVDHFLGMQTVQNILGLRFANRLFEPLWNGYHIDRVEIIWDETLALEGRAAYYDSAGALRDMLQNHLLQLLCLVGMEAPATLHDQDLRNRKVDLLRAVRRFRLEQVERHTVRARYGTGRVGGRDIPAYVDEAGVAPARGTETFAQVTMLIDNWRWAGVPFVLRSGKALRRERHEIAVHFRRVPHLAFGQPEEPWPNVLRLQLDPDRVALGVNLNGPGTPFPLERIELGTDFTSQGLPAYTRLLLQVLEGDCTLSIRDDEAEESWRVITPILDAWAQGRVPLLEYPAGSDGPTAATRMPGGQHSGRRHPGHGPMPGVG
jgi:glucose-6-phosphate 1-dehydrogenase